MNVQKSLSIFGFSKLKEFQKPIIDDMLNNRDILVCIGTGAGKSLCYQLPAILGNGFH